MLSVNCRVLDVLPRGAISAIVFKQQAPILDGNVKRVLARFCAIDGWPGKMDVVTKLWSVAETYTPKSRIADYTQAMMDLGATLCTRSSPDCPSCPYQAVTVWHMKTGTRRTILAKNRKRLFRCRNTCFLMITNRQGRLAASNKIHPLGLWGGLWVFPQCDSPQGNKRVR